MSSVKAGSRTQRSRADREHRNELVGTTVALVLAPVVVAAFGIALIGLIEALTGWSPELVKRLTPDDSIYIQTGFTKVRVVMIVAGVGVGYLAALVIQWALHFSAPAKRRPLEDPVAADVAVVESSPDPTTEPTTLPTPGATTQTQPVTEATSRRSPAVDRPDARPVDRPQAQSVAEPASPSSA